MSRKSASLKLVYSKSDLFKGLGVESLSKTDTPPKLALAKDTRGADRSFPPEILQICENGERTKILTVLAGKLINQGRPLEEVVQLTTLWNRGNKPPLDVEKVESTCAGILKTHQRHHPEQVSANSDLIDVPLFDLEQARVSSFLKTAPLAKRWLLKDCLSAGKVGAIIAPGGTGKSQTLLQLGVSVATGLPFLGFYEVTEPGGVLILFAEDDQEEIHHRLHNIHAIVTARHSDDKELSARIESNLYIRSMVAKKIKDLKLIIIDPASRFRGGIENSAEDVTRFIEQLEYIKKHTGATVLVAHHANKGSSSATESHQNASRGSSAFTDGVRWQMNLATLTRDDAKLLKISDDRRHFYVTANVVKNNYAAPTDGILLERKDQGYLEKVDLAMLEQVTEISLLNKVKTILRADESTGVQYTRTSFEDKYGGTEKQLGTAIIPLRVNLKRWVTTGKLFEVKGKLKADAPMPSR